ncbi:CBS domain-containing protein [Thermomonospora echinospora]|uniref:CBS domain-containing protein n=1 Tax=Thermomonospora echinospora TaxID=1992 RepID=A0A1H5SZ75_9ACTN|nr:CBS domain-containing protein [Thermomonospora echinospora]SEF55829.1 CBS domain-containing protein [Thermomonospora echinospora]
MLVREAMTSPVVTVPPSATVRQAIRVLYEHDITAAPVVDGTGAVIGIVSEMDLMRGEFQADPRAFVLPVAGPHEPPPRLVRDVMITDVRTAQPTSDVAELAQMMLRTAIKSVPVLDDGVLVGMISRRDLMAVLSRGDARIRDDVLASLAELLPKGHSWTAEVHDGVVRLNGPTDPGARHIAETLALTVPGVTRVLLQETN